MFQKEFQETTTLMNSEVKVLLEHRMKNDEGRRDDVELSEVFQKTLDYCKVISFKSFLQTKFSAIL